MAPFFDGTEINCKLLWPGVRIILKRLYTGTNYKRKVFDLLNRKTDSTVIYFILFYKELSSEKGIVYYFSVKIA